MSADLGASPPADEQFVERLTAYLDHAGAGSGVPDEEFADLGALLRADATWSGPPPSLRDSILAAAAPPAPVPSPGPVRERRRWRARWGRLSFAVPAVAVAAALFTAGVVAVDRALQPNPPSGVTYVATGTSAMPGASADVSMADTASGLSVVIQFHHLAPAGPGTYYAAWLRGPRGVVPLGSFHWHHPGNPVTMWSGVEPRDYPTFFVTVQQEGAPPVPSGTVILTAELTR